MAWLPGLDFGEPMGLQSLRRDFDGNGFVGRGRWRGSGGRGGSYGGGRGGGMSTSRFGGGGGRGGAGGPARPQYGNYNAGGNY